MTEARRRSRRISEHRRLLVIACGLVVVFVLLGAQLVRLAVFEGESHRARAQMRLRSTTWIPTWRGRIIDRTGRVLAIDEPGYEIAVPFDVITGVHVETQAARSAVEDLGVETWLAMGPARRAEAIAERRPCFEEEVERLWALVRALGGIDAAALAGRLDAIRAHVQHLAAEVWDAQARRREMRFGDSVDFRPRPIREQHAAHVVLPHVNDEMAVAFRRFEDGHPDLVQVRDTLDRRYPLSSMSLSLDPSSIPGGLPPALPLTIEVTDVARRLLGAMRSSAWAEDVVRRPFVDGDTGIVDLGGYRPGDPVGTRGLERAFEDLLRGNRGRLVRARSGDVESRTDPVPGHDLQVTIDAMLQARLQAILSPTVGLAVVQPWHGSTALPVGSPLRASIVVLDVPTGEILGMAGTPGAIEGEPSASSRLNRPVEGVYPPGSIIKPIVLAAALADRSLADGEPIECTGHYFPGVTNVARCWIYRQTDNTQTHGLLEPAEGLARSCNIFFYTLASRLGIERLLAWYERFGLGAPLDTGLLHDLDDGTLRGGAAGHLPTTQEIRELRRRGEIDFETVILGIGQGRITWTPLHAANAYATLARGGVRLDPTLVRGDRETSDRKPIDLALPEHAVRVVLDGLDQALHELWGTGHHLGAAFPGRPIINARGIRTWGKTGTAQAPALAFDRDGDGRLDETLTGLDHAWFLLLAAPEDDASPRYAIAVLVEHGGSGGRVAGPIADLVVDALQVEGYLPGIAR